MIDDNEDDYKIFLRLLCDSHNLFYHNGDSFEDALATIINLDPDLIFLDYHIATRKGLDLLLRLKSIFIIGDIPVIMLTGETDPRTIISSMKSGAFDYVIKDHSSKKELLEMIDICLRKSKLNGQRNYDFLTHVYDKSFFIERVDDEIEKAKRSQTIFSFAILDLDHFKEVNDQYGHLAGDIVLKKIAGIIRENIRKTDFVGRFGGDEFMIVLTEPFHKSIEVIKQNHMDKYEQIRELIENCVMVKSHQVFLMQELSNQDLCHESFYVTTSVGVVFYNNDINRFEDLLSIGDQYLYKSKSKGGNCVVTERFEVLS